MEHIGEKFNKLTIIDLYRKDKRSRKYYLCKCDCGNTKVVRYDCLTSNNTQSCGCALKESAKRNGNKKLYVNTSAADVEVTPKNNIPVNATKASQVFESLSEIAFTKNITARYDSTTETLNIGLK